MHHALEWMDTPANAVIVVTLTVLVIVAVLLATELLLSISRARKARRTLAEIRARHLTEAFRPQLEGTHRPVTYTELAQRYDD